MTTRTQRRFDCGCHLVCSVTSEEPFVWKGYLRLRRNYVQPSVTMHSMGSATRFTSRPEWFTSGTRTHMDRCLVQGWGLSLMGYISMPWHLLQSIVSPALQNPSWTVLGSGRKHYKCWRTKTFDPILMAQPRNMGLGKGVIMKMTTNPCTWVRRRKRKRSHWKWRSRCRRKVLERHNISYHEFGRLCQSILKTALTTMRRSYGLSGVEAEWGRKEVRRKFCFCVKRCGVSSSFFLGNWNGSRIGQLQGM